MNKTPEEITIEAKDILPGDTLVEPDSTETSRIEYLVTDVSRDAHLVTMTVQDKGWFPNTGRTFVSGFRVDYTVMRSQSIISLKEENEKLTLQTANSQREYLLTRNTLRDLESENKRLREALEEIVNPFKYMQIRAKKEGVLINGMMAIQLEKDSAYLKSIASAALNPTPICKNGCMNSEECDDRCCTD